jgi:serine/threonine-protein kinase
MAPEQARGEPATAASDLYAFGIVLQELFTGRPAYATAPTMVAMLYSVAEARVERPTDLDPEVAKLIRELTARAPAKRPTAAGALAALQALRERPERRKRQRRSALAAAVLVAVVAGIAWTAHRFGERRGVALEAGARTPSPSCPSRSPSRPTRASSSSRPVSPACSPTPLGAFPDSTLSTPRGSPRRCATGAA